MPRLFRKRLSAKRALEAWLRGAHIGDHDGGGVSKIRHMPSRIPADMEIVELNLLEVAA
jgi:hypothetical protein